MGRDDELGTETGTTHVSSESRHMNAAVGIVIFLRAVLLACAFALADGARAQDAEDPGSADGAAEDQQIPEELELTMKLMPEDAVLPEAVTRTIELPPPADARAAEAAAPGQARANEARERGLDTAAEARDKGRELGEQMAEQARENREDAGRGRPPEPPPGGPPEDPPGPPDGL